AAPLLLARLAVEQDPAVFVELDSALAGLAAEAPAFGPLERPDAAARAAVQERWQQRRGRLGW
ncbi:MAG: hypothetical protein KDE27_16805, partial [Planctomycetes bacterium]|nr:hypothetical protein [Planctomycetota bacterium]